MDVALNLILPKDFSFSHQRSFWRQVTSVAFVLTTLHPGSLLSYPYLDEQPTGGKMTIGRKNYKNSSEKLDLNFLSSSPTCLLLSLFVFLTRVVLAKDDHSYS